MEGFLHYSALVPCHPEMVRIKKAKKRGGGRTKNYILDGNNLKMKYTRCAVQQKHEKLNYPPTPHPHPELPSNVYELKETFIGSEKKTFYHSCNVFAPSIRNTCNNINFEFVVTISLKKLSHVFWICLKNH